jgi:hypothetical protein
MPKRKEKKGSSMNGSASKPEQPECGLCCDAIVEDRDEALFCEGSCNKWMHRYCAGVSVSHYEALQDSPLPFLCSLCAQSKYSETIEEMKAAIAALERSASATPTDKSSTSEVTGENKNEWTNVERRTRQRSTRSNNNRNRGGKRAVQRATNVPRES